MGISLIFLLKVKLFLKTYFLYISIFEIFEFDQTDLNQMKILQI